MAGGHLLTLRRRAAWLSVFSGMLCWMPRRRRLSRQDLLLYAVSAARRLPPGAPQEHLATEKPQVKGVKGSPL